MNICQRCGNQVPVGQICNCTTAQHQPSGAPSYGQPPPPGQSPYGQPPPPGQSPYGQPPPPGQSPYGQPPPPGAPPYGQPPPPGSSYYSYPYGQQPVLVPQFMPLKPKAAPGEKLIKVVGILLTIFGGIGVLSNVSAFAVFFEMPWLYPDLYEYYLYFSVAITVITLSFGIVGICVAKNPRSGGVIIAFGALLLLIHLADSIWSYMSFGDILLYAFGDLGDFIDVEGLMLFSVIFGFIISAVLPILYIVGGIRRMKK